MEPGAQFGGRKWISVTPPARPTQVVELNSYGQVAVPRVPGNAHLSGLDRLIIERAHHNGSRAAIAHVDASGLKCPQCNPPRKTRAV